MPNSVNNVKTEYTFETKKAQGAISSLISKLKEFQALTNRDSGDKFGKSMQNSVKQSSSAIDSQVQKIANLKQSISEVKNQWKEASAIATEINKKLASLTRLAELGDAGKGGAYSSLLGVKAKEIESLYQQLDKLSMALSSATGSDLSRGQADVDAWVIKTTQDVKHEEEALRGMQREERKSASSAKSSTSAHKSFSQTLSKMSNVIKKIKSGLSSFVGNIKNIASSIKGAIPGANKFGGALGKLAQQFKRLFVLRLLRNAIAAMIRGFQEGVQNIVKYSAALNNMDANHANQSMSELASTILYLKNTLGSAAIPALNAVLPIIRAIATGFATAVNYVNQFISALGGKSSWTRAKQVTVDYASSLSDVGSSAGGAKDAVEDLKRTILGFDEINKLNDANSSSGSGGSGGGGGGSDTVSAEEMFEEVPIDNKVTKWLKDLKPYIDAIKDAWGDVKKAVKDLVESEGFKYLVSTTFKMVLSGIATILGGFAKTIDAIKDALNRAKIKDKIDGIKNAWDGVLSSVKTLTGSAAWKSVVETITFAGLSTLEDVLNSIKGLIDGIKKGLGDLEANGKLSAFADAWDGVGTAMSNLFNAEGFQALESTALYMFVTGITSALNGIKTIIDGVVRPALNELSQDGTFSKIKDDWDSIWGSVENIIKSDLFRLLVKGTLKTLIHEIETAMKGISGAFEIIEGFFTLDLSKIGSGFGKVVGSIISFFQPLFDLADQLLGTNLGWQNKVLAKSATEGISYQQAEWELKNEKSGNAVTNANGDLWAIKDIDGSYSFLPSRDTITQELVKFQQEWASLPLEERSLAFDAFIDAHPQEMAVLFQTQPWEQLPAEEKVLAFNAFIDSLPSDVAQQFLMGKGTSPGWYNLSDEERAMAWLTYISTKPSKVAEEYLKGWQKTGASLPFDANVEPAQETTGNFRDELANTIMNAPVDARTTKAKEAARKLREEINRTTATAPVDANTTSAFAQANKFRDDIKTKTTTAPVSAELKNGAELKTNLEGTLGNVIIKGKDGKIYNSKDIWDNFNTYMSDTHISAKDGKIYNSKDIWDNFNEYMDDTHILGKDDNIYNRKAIWDNFNDYMSDVKIKGVLTNPTELKSQAKAAFNDISVAVVGSGDMNKIAGNLYFQAKASGGLISPMSFVDSAQLFMARENGIPEYVGRFGSQSAVANNYQITEGIALGVQRATATQNELLREQNSLLREIASKSGNTSVSSILGAMNRVNKRTGTPVVQMG